MSFPISENDRYKKYTATAGQTVFAYDFEVLVNTSVGVIKNGTELTHGTDYAVAGVGDEGGGSITLVVGATVGDSIVVFGNSPYSREETYTGTTVTSTAGNASEEKIEFQLQQLNRDIDRSLRNNLTDGAIAELPPIASRASSFASWGADGSLGYSDPVTGLLGEYMKKDQNLSDVVSVATSRTNLGLGDSATKDVGIAAGTVASGTDSRFLTSGQKGGLTGGATTNASTLHTHTNLIPTSEKGANSGVATLNPLGTLTSAQVPSNVVTTAATGSADNEVVVFNGTSGANIKRSSKALPTGDIVGTTDAQTLTNKTIDADNNTVSELEVDNLKAGVPSTDISGVVTDTELPSAKASKAYADTKAGSVSNIGTGSGLGYSVASGDLKLKTIKAGIGIVITEDTDDIRLDAVGEGGIQTFANVGTGEGKVFKDITDSINVNLKTILAGDNIAVTNNANDIEIDVTGLGTIASQDADNVTITGGTIDGTVIGGTTPANGSFTNAFVNDAIELGTLDNFARPQIWNYETNSMLRLGASEDTGDATSVATSGAIFYGKPINGAAMDADNQGNARIKSNLFGLYSYSVGQALTGFYWSTDPTSMNYKNDANSTTFSVTRATGTLKAGSLRSTNLTEGFLKSDALGNITSEVLPIAIADGGTGASDAATARTNLGLGTIATQDSDTVAITGGNITGITDLAIADGGTGASDAATARTNLGLGDIATQNKVAIDITGGTITGITDLAVTDGGTGASTTGDARTNLGVAIGSDVQAYDDTLQSLSALGTAADKMAYTTALDTWAEADITAAGRAILDDADASAQRTTLGLGTIATQASDTVAITGGSVTGIADLTIADGGTGASTQTDAFDALSPTTTKGDIIASDGTNNIRLAVGTNDYILTADSVQTAGVKWTKYIKSGTGFSATIGTNQTITTSTTTVLDFDTEDYDPDSDFNTTTHRYTPSTEGVYLATTYMEFSSGAAGYTQIGIRKNAVIEAAMNFPTGSGTYNMSVAMSLYMNGSTDYIDTTVYQTSGSDKTVYAVRSGFQCELLRVN